MKNLITILILFVAFGCGKSEPLSPETSTQVLSSYAKLFGSYEIKEDGETIRIVLLENGKYEAWIDGEKKDDGTWKIEAKEVYLLEDGEEIPYILKIESNGELTMIARIKDNKREEAPKQHQRTFKKLK